MVFGLASSNTDVKGLSFQRDIFYYIFLLRCVLATESWLTLSSSVFKGLIVFFTEQEKSVRKLTKTYVQVQPLNQVIIEVLHPWLKVNLLTTPTILHQHIDQRRPLPTINCSYPKQAKEVAGNEASVSYYYYFFWNVMFMYVFENMVRLFTRNESVLVKNLLNLTFHAEVIHRWRKRLFIVDVKSYNNSTAWLSILIEDWPWHIGRKVFEHFLSIHSTNSMVDKRTKATFHMGVV